MKFGQLLEYPKINIFYQKLWKIFLSENDAGELVPVHFWFFKKPLYYVKTCGLQLDFTISIALKLAYNRNKLLKTLHYWSRDVLNFVILDKGLGITSPAHFVYIYMIFQQKCSSSYFLKHLILHFYNRWQIKEKFRFKVAVIFNAGY